MKLILKLSLISSLFLTSSFICLSSEENDEYIYNLWASVKKIEVLTNQNGRLNLKVSLTIPTPCNEFDKRELRMDGDTLFIKYYSKSKKNIICIQILGECTYYDTFNLTPGKSYLFKFYQHENKTLDTLIYIINK